MKLLRLLPSVALLAALVAPLQADDDSAVIWPVPPYPAGQPVATSPRPRLDWLDRFQANLNRYNAGPYAMIWDGDSITDNWQGAGKAAWAAHFGNIKTADFAIGGDQVQHVIWRVQHGQLKGQDPKLVMLMIGTNNLGQEPQGVVDGIKMLIGEYEKRCPHAQILLLGIFPRSPKPTDPARAWIAKVNAIISGYSSDPRVTYLDFGAKFLQPDGTLTPDIMADYLHPGAKGYEIWASAILPVVQKYFPEAKQLAPEVGE
jgi:lysophospholipase L1-like esterase